MAAPKYTPGLCNEYSRLFDTCEVSDAHADEVAGIIHRIANFQDRYTAVAATTGVPWFVIAVMHSMECELSFHEHLHNGDPLTARTVQVPAGRPKTGQPPFEWAASAADALAYDGLTKWKDWSVPGICYQLEGYNGWGYRGHEVNTPYLWSYSNHYTRGKYISDGEKGWSDSAVSRQCGAAVLLRRMAEKGQITLGAPVPAASKLPDPAALVAVPYRQHLPTDPREWEAAEDLQRLLSLFPGIFLKIDGIVGMQTSDAFKQIVGRYLPGDPRA